MSVELKELTDQLGTALKHVEDMKGELKELRESGTGTAEKQVQLEKAIEDATKAVEAIQERTDAVETQLSRPAAPEAKTDADKERLWSMHVRDMAMKAMKGKGWDIASYETPDELKALTVDDDSQAGFLIMEDVQRELIETNLVELDEVRGVVRVVSTSGNSIRWPSKTAHAAASWTAASGTISEDTSLTFGAIEIPTHKQTVLYDVERELIEDSAFDIGGILRDEFAQEFAQDEGAAVVNGDGDGKPFGFMQNSTVQTNATNSEDADSIVDSWDWVAKVMTSIKKPYWNNAVWATNRTTFGVWLAMSDGVQRPYMVPNTDRTLPMACYGKPIMLMESMPDLGAGNYPIAYGDFRRGYILVDKVGMQLQVDPYTQNTTDKVRFIARRRVGGQVVVPEAIGAVKCATT